MSLLHKLRIRMRRAGIEAHRANPMTMWQLRLPRLLAQKQVATVLDVGANDGGYASELLASGFRGSVISFEPLPDAWSALNDRGGCFGPRWAVAPRMALSNVNGEAEFHEAGNSVSSSLLPMTATHRAAAPASGTVNVIKVPTRRLDDVLNGMDASDPMFLKIDVQGAERLVLEGAAASLRGPILGVQLEMSLSSLYEEQPAAAELDALLRSQGFECWDMLPGFRDPRTLRLLQYDGVYFRADASA